MHARIAMIKTILFLTTDNPFHERGGQYGPLNNVINLRGWGKYNVCGMTLSGKP